MKIQMPNYVDKQANTETQAAQQRAHHETTFKTTKHQTEATKWQHEQLQAHSQTCKPHRRISFNTPATTNQPTRSTLQ